MEGWQTFSVHAAIYVYFDGSVEECSENIRSSKGLSVTIVSSSEGSR